MAEVEPNAKRRVLVVEDNALVQELLRQLLDDDYELYTADNGKLGVQAALAHRPHVILMDLTMPVMDGWTAIRALRAERATARIPILALSARIDPGDVERAMEAGADAHLAKPIDDEELLRAIERLTVGRRPTSGVWGDRAALTDAIAAKKSG
jgi:CheY-like chemotaxis protein